MLGRKRRNLLGRCEQRANVDVESKIRERRGDDLLPAIMPILAHFGDEDARSMTLVLHERAGHCDHTVGSLFAGASLRQVNAGDGASFRNVPTERVLERQ